MSQVGTTEIVGEVGVLTIDYPPVNALSAHTRIALDEGFRAFAADDRVKAIVLICAGRTFIAGADISEFGKPSTGPNMLEVFDRIENGAKPVVAAIHGTALGGGFETALICHYRIAVPSARIGLPEVALGLLPGGGGTQRLPRIVGIPAALDLITGGAPVSATKALELGMIDALAEEGRLREDAIAFAARLVAEKCPLLRVRDRQDPVGPYRGKPEIYAEYLAKNARAFRGFKAPFNIVKAIEAAAELPFEQGILRERELFGELMTSTESAAQRYYFFAEREAAKVPDLPKDTPVRPFKSVGVIGAGTMGGGIAMNFLNAGVPVTLVEMNQAALDRGSGVIRKTYETTAAKGRMTAAQVEQRMALLTPALGLEALADADLVIEAVFEEIGVKQDVFARLDGVAKPGAILASNTSFLDLDAIAAATSRAQSVVGLHFFSPADVMRLLEIVRGAATSNEALATALKIAKAIGKVPVVSRVGPGFIANRVMGSHSRQVIDLFLEGPTPLDVDQAIVARLLYPVVNEGAKVLDEGVAIRASDIDVACILGYNWPVYTGGPMFWADIVGLPEVVEGLRAVGIEPARLLAEKAVSGGSFTR